ncbi:hypothetical protein KR054_009505 [Drosophila jambulina]|nr:hypothetical protein KR054_009505 [Drosophila jambulina]
MAKTNESDSESSGVLDTLDKVCRWIVPGYNYLCNRLFGMRDHLEDREVSSEVIYLNNGREITDEIYEGAGISKSEFCEILEELIRKKVIEMQKRMSQVEPQDNDVPVLEESVQTQVEPPNENQDMAVTEDRDQSQVVQTHALRPTFNPEVSQRMMLAMVHKAGRKADRSTDSSNESPRKKARLEENPETENQVPSDDMEMAEEEKPVEAPEAETNPTSFLDYARKYQNH